MPCTIYSPQGCTEEVKDTGVATTLVVVLLIIFSRMQPCLVVRSLFITSVRGCTVRRRCNSMMRLPEVVFMNLLD